MARACREGEGKGGEGKGDVTNAILHHMQSLNRIGIQLVTCN